MDSLSNLIALVPAPPGAAIARSNGEAERVDLRDARAFFEGGDVLVAHSTFVAGRLGSRASGSVHPCEVGRAGGSARGTGGSADSNSPGDV